MLKKIILPLATVALLSTGCSDSYPTTEEGLATAVCNEFKALNLDGVEKYMDPSKESIERFQKDKKFMLKMLSKEKVKKAISSTDCSKQSKAPKKYEDYTRYYFGEIKIKVKKIGDTWRAVN